MRWLKTDGEESVLLAVFSNVLLAYCGLISREFRRTCMGIGGAQSRHKVVEISHLGQWAPRPATRGDSLRTVGRYGERCGEQDSNGRKTTKVK
jgi:hypothetical protein